MIKGSRYDYAFLMAYNVPQIAAAAPRMGTLFFLGSKKRPNGNSVCAKEKKRANRGLERRAVRGILKEQMQ